MVLHNMDLLHWIDVGLENETSEVIIFFLFCIKIFC